MAKLQDGVSVIMEFTDLMPCREASVGRKNTSDVPDCIRFCNLEHWNYDRQVCRSNRNIANIDLCCVRETRWTGSGVRVMVRACQGINSSGRVVKTVMRGQVSYFRKT